MRSAPRRGRNKTCTPARLLHLPALRRGRRANLPRRRRRAACWYSEGVTTELDFCIKTTNRTRGASRVAGGLALRLGQGAGPTRIAQGRRVGGLRPKLHSIGVAGEFGDVVESAKNGRRGRRAGPAAPLGAHHAMASTRRARRRRGRFARRPRRKGGKCSNSRSVKLRPTTSRRAAGACKTAGVVHQALLRTGSNTGHRNHARRCCSKRRCVEEEEDKPSLQCAKLKNATYQASTTTADCAEALVPHTLGCLAQ